jgi:hypothetical protein
MVINVNPRNLNRFTKAFSDSANIGNNNGITRPFLGEVAFNPGVYTDPLAALAGRIRSAWNRSSSVGSKPSLTQADLKRLAKANQAVAKGFNELTFFPFVLRVNPTKTGKFNPVQNRLAEAPYGGIPSDLFSNRQVVQKGRLTPKAEKALFSTDKPTYLVLNEPDPTKPNNPWGKLTGGRQSAKRNTDTILYEGEAAWRLAAGHAPYTSNGPKPDPTVFHLTAVNPRKSGNGPFATAVTPTPIGERRENVVRVLGALDRQDALKGKPGLDGSSLSDILTAGWRTQFNTYLNNPLPAYKPTKREWKLNYQRQQAVDVATPAGQRAWSQQTGRDIRDLTVSTIDAHQKLTGQSVPQIVEEALSGRGISAGVVTTPKQKATAQGLAALNKADGARLFENFGLEFWGDKPITYKKNGLPRLNQG